MAHRCNNLNQLTGLSIKSESIVYGNQLPPWDPHTFCCWRFRWRRLGKSVRGFWPTVKGGCRNWRNTFAVCCRSGRLMEHGVAPLGAGCRSHFSASPRGGSWAGAGAEAEADAERVVSYSNGWLNPRMWALCRFQLNLQNAETRPNRCCLCHGYWNDSCCCCRLLTTE